MVRIKRQRTSSSSPLSPQCILSAMLLLFSFFFVIKHVGKDEKEGHQYAKILMDETLEGFRKETVSDLSHLRGSVRGDHQIPADFRERPEPISVAEVIQFLSDFILQLHDELAAYATSKQAITFHEVWRIYHDLAVTTLYPWDLEYMQRMPKQRNDNSIFLSIASFRDENCLNTIKGAFGKAENPENLFVGLVQQNCERNCKTGILDGGVVENSEADEDCHRAFCESPEGGEHCKAGRVRALHIEENDALGPYAARYFASKLWGGEQWFMQIDSHMTFAQKWDTASLKMLSLAPSEKPVISHYPPGEDVDLEQIKQFPAPRICGPVFASLSIEAQIIRLEGAGVYDQNRIDVPRFAPFVAAGYFMVHSDFLREVPFDPFLPWIFMGEEIILSVRLWTSGYDIFSPSHSIVGHVYVRAHKPKFWESIGRLFWKGMQISLQRLVLERVKMQLGYPESSQDMVMLKTLFTGIQHYTVGTERTLDDYMKIIGVDPVTKYIWSTDWCETGQPPDYAKDRAYLYEE